MRWRLLGHPYFTGAVALLALNDHVLKRAAPGFVTGKLSDFVGVFVMAVVATALTERPRFSTSAVGLGFGALKLAPAAASLAAPLLGGVTRQDPTDLVALVMLVPALRFSRRWFSTDREHSLAQVFVSILAGALAVLTMSATSCYRPPTVDAFVVREDGAVLARVNDEVVNDSGNAVPSPRWALSTDGGATWRAADKPSELPSTADRSCSDVVGCFRVQRDRVEHAATAGGPFAVAFSFTAEQRRRMQSRTGADCGVSATDLFKAVAIVNQPDGPHIVVAMGTQGALHRSPTGRWSRVVILDRKPVSLRGPSWLRQLSLAPLAVMVLSPIPLVWAWRRRGRDRGLAALGVGLGGGLLLASFAGGLMVFGLDYTIAGPVIALLALAVFAMSVAFAFVGRRRVPLEGNAAP